MGHSFGGTIALEYASCHSDNVQKLIILTALRMFLPPYAAGKNGLENVARRDHNLREKNLTMYLYRTSRGILARSDKNYFQVPDTDFDELLSHQSLYAYLSNLKADAKTGRPPLPEELLAPVGAQEVWAAGVTYERSREGRREEAQESGAAVFYSRVYDAERPELFFKAAGWRVVAPYGKIRVRRDARSDVPEPELVLVINRDAKIIGYTLGNDVSSRDIGGGESALSPSSQSLRRQLFPGPCHPGDGRALGSGHGNRLAD